MSGLAFIGAVSVVSIIIVIGLNYYCLFYANKLTNFGAPPRSLLIVTIITFLIGTVPTIGLAVSIISQYLMLKKINPDGSVAFTMVIYFIMAAILTLIFTIIY